MASLSDYVGPLDLAAEEPIEETVIVSIDERVLLRAHELARAQSTDEEIAATLHLGERLSLERASELVAEHAEDLQLARLQGRAELREFAFDVARGRRGDKLSTSQIAILQLIGAQHLGFSREGFDLKTRKLVEKAEKHAAKTRRGAS